MDTLFRILCSFILAMESLVGIVANGSVVLINFIDWFRSGRLSPIDQILICLGLARLLLQAILMLHIPLLQISALSNVVFILLVTSIFTNFVNLWFAACLSVFYLVKIAIFSHPVFLQVKRRFSGLVPWLLLGSVISSAVMTIITTTSWNDGWSTCHPYNSLLSNRSNAERNMPEVCRSITALTDIFTLIPFMIFLSSSIFLISSLWKHMRRVQCNGAGTRDLNTQAHLSAIRALAAFTVLYMISFIAIASKSVVDWYEQHTWRIVFINLSALYPSGHAIILILINPKLKQTWVRMLHHLKCHLKKVPS